MHSGAFCISKGLPHQSKSSGETRSGTPRVERARGDQAVELGPQPSERPGAVAELHLDQRAQLAKRSVIFGDEEERIVAEPVRSAGRAGDPPSTGARSLQ